MSGVECPRSDCIVPIGVPTESSIVAWLCLRRCHVTPGSPSFFATGFRCLRKRFQRCSGNPSHILKSQVICLNSGRTDASEIFLPSPSPMGMVRALRLVLGLSKCPSYTVSQTRSKRAFRSCLPEQSAHDRATRNPVSINSNATERAGSFRIGSEVWELRPE